MNKQEADAILEPLRDKTLSRGCILKHKETQMLLDSRKPYGVVLRGWASDNEYGRFAGVDIMYNLSQRELRNGNDDHDEGWWDSPNEQGQIDKDEDILSTKTHKANWTDQECGDFGDFKDYGFLASWEILGHPILIGDVLEKWGKLEAKKTIEEVSDECSDLCSYWCKCGFTKSLQEIVAEGREEVCTNCQYSKELLENALCCKAGGHKYEEALKQEAEELLKFIKSLGLK